MQNFLLAYRYESVSELAKYFLRIQIILSRSATLFFTNHIHLQFTMILPVIWIKMLSLNPIRDFFVLTPTGMDSLTSFLPPPPPNHHSLIFIGRSVSQLTGSRNQKINWAWPRAFNLCPVSAIVDQFFLSISFAGCPIMDFRENKQWATLCGKITRKNKE